MGPGQRMGRSSDATRFGKPPSRREMDFGSATFRSNPEAPQLEMPPIFPADRDRSDHPLYSCQQKIEKQRQWKSPFPTPPSDVHPLLLDQCLLFSEPTGWVLLAENFAVETRRLRGLPVSL